MFSQIASVFSTHGVVLPGSERIPVYKKAPEAPCDHKNNCSCFAPKFEQASAKLELSKRARDGISAAAARKESGSMDAAASEGAPGSKSSDGKPLSEDEKSQVVDLEKRDREVKAHEAAHSANAGGFAKGGAGYEYQTGPDGRKYAVGGHVDIDVSPVRGDPQATLQKAQTVQRAALAPADPSGQDRAVAAAAAQMAMQAQKEMNQGGEAGGTGGPVDGNRTSQPDGGRDPRRAYSRVPSRTGSGLSVYA